MIKSPVGLHSATLRAQPHFQLHGAVRHFHKGLPFNLQVNKCCSLAHNIYITQSICLCATPETGTTMVMKTSTWRLPRPEGSISQAAPLLPGQWVPAAVAAAANMGLATVAGGVEMPCGFTLVAAVVTVSRTPILTRSGTDLVGCCRRTAAAAKPRKLLLPPRQPQLAAASVTQAPAPRHLAPALRRACSIRRWFRRSEISSGTLGLRQPPGTRALRDERR